MDHHQMIYEVQELKAQLCYEHNEHNKQIRRLHDIIHEQAREIEWLTQERIEHDKAVIRRTNDQSQLIGLMRDVNEQLGLLRAGQYILITGKEMRNPERGDQDEDTDTDIDLDVGDQE